MLLSSTFVSTSLQYDKKFLTHVKIQLQPKKETTASIVECYNKGIYM